jgi:abortive infection bacteriophage resistance protein
MIYSKPPITIDEQLNKLQERGLIFDDIELAKACFSNISYYRLAGYWWPMYADKRTHIFKPNSKFSDVMALYRFDHRLGMLIFDIIEKIEISLRTKLIYHLSHEFDPWWFERRNLFSDTQSLTKTLYKIQEEVERSKDVFMKEHKRKYKEDKRFPPAWKTLELTSFGSLSRLYGNLKNDVGSKDVIAQELGAVNHTYLPSWLQSIAQIRNFCAHHSRLWNKNLPGTVKLLSKPPYRWVEDVPTEGEFQHLYIHLCLMRYLLNVIEPSNTFHARLKDLMLKFEGNVDPKALGFKENWQEEALWN